MVQSSRGWDAAPHSGWGVKPSAPSKGKGAKSPRGVPPGAAFRDGLGTTSPLPSPRAASPLATPEWLARSAGCAHLSSPARVGWAGTAVGRPARSCGGGWAGARGSAGGRWLPGPGGGAAPAAGPGGHRARAMEGSIGMGSLLCLVRPPRHLPSIACPRPIFTSGRHRDPERPRLEGRGDSMLGSVSLNSGPGWAGRRPRSTFSRVERKGGSQRPLGSWLLVL